MAERKTSMVPFAAGRTSLVGTPTRIPSPKGAALLAGAEAVADIATRREREVQEQQNATAMALGVQADSIMIEARDAALREPDPNKVDATYQNAIGQRVVELREAITDPALKRRFDTSVLQRATAHRSDLDEYRFKRTGDIAISDLQAGIITQVNNSSTTNYSDVLASQEWARRQIDLTVERGFMTHTAGLEMKLAAEQSMDISHIQALVDNRRFKDAEFALANSASLSPEQRTKLNRRILVQRSDYFYALWTEGLARGAPAFGNIPAMWGALNRSFANNEITPEHYRAMAGDLQRAGVGYQQSKLTQLYAEDFLDSGLIAQANMRLGADGKPIPKQNVVDDAFGTYRKRNPDMDYMNAAVKFAAQYHEVPSDLIYSMHSLIASNDREKLRLGLEQYEQIAQFLPNNGAGLFSRIKEDDTPLVKNRISRFNRVKRGAPMSISRPSERGGRPQEQIFTTEGDVRARGLRDLRDMDSAIHALLQMEAPGGEQKRIAAAASIRALDQTDALVSKRFESQIEDFYGVRPPRPIISMFMAETQDLIVESGLDPEAALEEALAQARSENFGPSKQWGTGKTTWGYNGLQAGTPGTFTLRPNEVGDDTLLGGQNFGLGPRFAEANMQILNQVRDMMPGGRMKETFGLMVDDLIGNLVFQRGWMPPYAEPLSGPQIPGDPPQSNTQITLPLVVDYLYDSLRDDLAKNEFKYSDQEKAALSNPDAFRAWFNTHITGGTHLGSQRVDLVIQGVEGSHRQTFENAAGEPLRGKPYQLFLDTGGDENTHLLPLYGPDGYPTGIDFEENLYNTTLAQSQSVPLEEQVRNYNASHPWWLFGATMPTSLINDKIKVYQDVDGILTEKDPYPGRQRGRRHSLFGDDQLIDLKRLTDEQGAFDPAQMDKDHWPGETLKNAVFSGKLADYHKRQMIDEIAVNALQSVEQIDPNETEVGMVSRVLMETYRDNMDKDQLKERASDLGQLMRPLFSDEDGLFNLIEAFAWNSGVDSKELANASFARLKDEYGPVVRKAKKKFDKAWEWMTSPMDPTPMHWQSDDKTRRLFTDVQWGQGVNASMNLAMHEPLMRISLAWNHVGKELDFVGGKMRVGEMTRDPSRLKTAAAAGLSAKIDMIAPSGAAMTREQATKAMKAIRKDPAFPKGWRVSLVSGSKSKALQMWLRPSLSNSKANTAITEYHRRFTRSTYGDPTMQKVYARTFEKEAQAYGLVEPKTDVSGVRPEMLPALRAVRFAFQSAGLPVFRVTSGLREKHPVTGEPDIKLHSVGFGFDIGTKEFTREQVGSVVRILRRELPIGFRVIDKDHGTGPHIHIELKTPATMAILEERRQKVAR